MNATNTAEAVPQHIEEERTERHAYREEWTNAEMVELVKATFVRLPRVMVVPSE